MITFTVLLGFSQLVESSCSRGSRCCETGFGHFDACHASKNGRWKRKALFTDLPPTANK